MALEVVAALGAVYGVAGPGEVLRHPIQGGGVGGSPSRLERVKVWFRLPMGDVAVATSLREGRDPIITALILVFSRIRNRSLRFRLTIRVTREEIVIPGERR